MKSAFPIAPDALAALLAEHDVVSQHYGDDQRLSVVMEYIGVDLESRSLQDVLISCVIASMASEIDRTRAAMREAQNVPLLPLREALAKPYVCPECDEQACVCWAYDVAVGRAMHRAAA